MDDKDKSDGKRLGLSGAQVFGSALAAVTGAVLASGLGMYGTILGAGLISVVATVGSALYQRLAQRTGRQLKEGLFRGIVRTSMLTHKAAEDPPAPRRPADAAETVRLPTVSTGPATGTVHDSKMLIPTVTAEEAAAALPQDNTPEPRRRPRRRTYVLAAVGVFVTAMLIITGLELVTNSTLSGWWGNDGGKGGTTITRSVEHDGKDSQRDSDPDSDSDPGTRDDKGGTSKNPKDSEDSSTGDGSGHGTEDTDGTGDKGDTGDKEDKGDGGKDDKPDPTPTPTPGTSDNPDGDGEKGETGTGDSGTKHDSTRNDSTKNGTTKNGTTENLG